MRIAGGGAMNLIIPFRPGIVPGMTSVSITDLKANLSRHLREVRRGGEIQVLNRGKPIARLVPTQSLTKADKTRDKLIREGVIIPGKDTAANVLDRPPLELKINLSQALQEDREDRV